MMNRSLVGDDSDAVPLIPNTVILSVQDDSEENSSIVNNRKRSIRKNTNIIKKCILLSFVILIIVASILTFVIIATKVNQLEQGSKHSTTQVLQDHTSTDLPWTSAFVAQQSTKKVLFIIVDGVPADVIEHVSIPNIKKIQQIGHYTRAYVGGDNGSYSETPTISAPGYMDLLTGTWGNKHNVSDNNDTVPNYNYKNIFRLLKEHQPNKTIAIFSTWTDNRVQLIGEGLIAAGNITFDYKFDGYELDETTYPHDPEDHYIYDIDQRVTDEASKCIQMNAPDLSWVYLQYTDDLGHIFGDSEQFNQGVTNADKQIGQIWGAVDYRMKYYKEDWIIIVTTDHGRDPITGKEHGDQSDRERTTWMAINSRETNTYFRDFQPAIVDLLPTIARWMDVSIPLESERELDGIPLTGKVSLVKPNISLHDDNLQINWQVLDHAGNVRIWLSTTNHFKNGLKDRYISIRTVPIDEKSVTIDVKKYPSKFYKIVLEGQHNIVNRWVLRS